MDCLACGYGGSAWKKGTGHFEHQDAASSRHMVLHSSHPSGSSVVVPFVWTIQRWCDRGNNAGAFLSEEHRNGKPLDKLLSWMIIVDGLLI